ncbi:MAG TPA: ATP synthase F0 subunit B [Candidatus Acidoferrales bacterium]|nr:ATP synthase F0 subunit B [Candidatus Acidoferrales bacterium]
MFLSIDGTFWIQIINFFIFYAILNVVYIKPASAALRKRREYIDSVHNEYEAALREVEELKNEADTKRAEGRREGDHTAATIRNEAMRQAEEIVSRAQDEFSRIVEESESKIHRELNTARAEEHRLVRELADEMVARAVGRL